VVPLPLPTGAFISVLDKGKAMQHHLRHKDYKYRSQQAYHDHFHGACNFKKNDSCRTGKVHSYGRRVGREESPVSTDFEACNSQQWGTYLEIRAIGAFYLQTLPPYQFSILRPRKVSNYSEVNTLAFETQVKRSALLQTLIIIDTIFQETDRSSFRDGPKEKLLPRTTQH
jgi:hypothetical protein